MFVFLEDSPKLFLCDAIGSTKEGYLLLTELGGYPYSFYLPISRLNRQQETEMANVATERILEQQPPLCGLVETLWGTQQSAAWPC